MAEPLPPVDPAPPVVPVPPLDVDPLEPVADDSVLADAPDTTTAEHHLIPIDEGRPGPGV